MDRRSTLDAAAKTVLNERNKSYGTPSENFALVARYWSVLFGVTVEPHQVALAQDLLKTARLHHDPAHADSWVDKAGYSACGAEVAAHAARKAAVVPLQPARYEALHPSDVEAG